MLRLRAAPGASRRSSRSRRRCRSTCPTGSRSRSATDPPLPLAWRTCGPDGCAARLTVTPELAAALRRERGGTATFTPADGVPVRVAFSLIGYTAALRAAGG